MTFLARTFAKDASHSRSLVAVTNKLNWCKIRSKCKLKYVKEIGISLNSLFMKNIDKSLRSQPEILYDLDLRQSNQV